ncbi:MAG: peptide ABC transporter substrate-binding protein, partial [Gammaproteobacteria bacterium]|nr:peptide ABC transporter substrate-binding protein [Gammaproteobacteria bacterium]
MSDKNDFKDLITRDAKSGKLGRRDFMRFAIAAGMTIPMASGLWTSEVAAATPKRGGTFRIAQHDGNTSDNHDPGTYVSFATIALAHTFRAYLTQINPDQTLGGDVATEWSATPDARNWTFKL